MTPAEKLMVHASSRRSSERVHITNAAPTPVADPGPPRAAAPALDDDSDDDLL